MTSRIWELEVEVLVVGSGAGALTAGLVAAAEGAKTAIIEKDDRYGGASATSGGALWIPNSHLAKAAGHEDTRDEAFRYLRALSSAEIPDKLIWAYVEAAPQMFEWMERNADLRYFPIPYPDFHQELPGAKPGWRTHMAVDMDGRALGEDIQNLRPPASAVGLFGRINMSPSESHPILVRAPGWKRILLKVLARYYGDIGQRLKSPRDRFLSLGNALVGRLKLALNRRGVPLMLRTRLTGLVCEDGRVIGAETSRGGKPFRIRASRGVILAAGGFEHDAAMRAQYLTRLPDASGSATPLANTGDAIRAAIDIGAATVNMNSAWWATVFKFPGREPAHFCTSERTLPGQIIVTAAGRPYDKAPFSYHDWGELMAKADRPDGRSSFILFDSAYRARFPMGPILPGIPDWLLAPSIRSVLIKGRRWADIARKTGLPAAALQETIDRFNDDVREGRQISKMPELAPAPLSEPPFYALPIYPGDVGTNGGLAIDENGRVLNSEGRPIAGLYAAGNNAATISSISSPGLGAILGPAMTFGYLAAKHATEAPATVV